MADVLPQQETCRGVIVLFDVLGVEVDGQVAALVVEVEAVGGLSGVDGSAGACRFLARTAARPEAADAERG